MVHLTVHNEGLATSAAGIKKPAPVVFLDHCGSSFSTGSCVFRGPLTKDPSVIPDHSSMRSSDSARGNERVFAVNFSMTGESTRFFRVEPGHHVKNYLGE